ncbi:hypothetical protein DVDV_0361 [Desulfovibrio sp. DV]|nr:hypothetical protein DVDV_0361 [Desulfovibrio sp. DV]
MGPGGTIQPCARVRLSGHSRRAPSKRLYTRKPEIRQEAGPGSHNDKRVGTTPPACDSTRLYAP